MSASLLDPEPIDDQDVSVHLDVSATGVARFELFDMSNDVCVSFKFKPDVTGIAHATSVIDALNAWIDNVCHLNETIREKE